MAYCTDAFSRGFTHSIRLLFQPFRLIFWLKAGLLFLFIQGITLISPLDYLPNISPDESMDQMAERVFEMLPTLLGVLTVSMLLGVIMEALHAWSRFLFIDAVRDGVIYYRQSTRRHLSSIVSLFLWNVAMKIVLSILLVICLVLLLIPNWILVTLIANQAGLILCLTLDALFLLFLVFLYITYSILLDGLVVPQMTVKSMGIFEAWRKAFQAVGKQLGEWIGYALIRIALWLAFFFFVMAISTTYSIFSAGFSLAISGSTMEFGEKLFLHEALLPIQIIIAFLLLPIPIFRDAYALCFLSKMNNDSDYEPQGDYRLPSETAPEPVKTNETDPFAGPVSFKDIPTVRFNAGPVFPPPSEEAPQTDTDRGTFPPSTSSGV